MPGALRNDQASAYGAGFLLRPRIRRALDATTSAVLIAFGLHLATERH